MKEKNRISKVPWDQIRIIKKQKNQVVKVSIRYTVVAAVGAFLRIPFAKIPLNSEFPA